MKITMLMAVAAVSAGICPATLAQSSDTSDARQSYVLPMFSGDTNAINSQEGTMETDTKPLSGALKWTTGSENATNMLLPTLQFSEMGDTNASNSSARGGPQAITTLSSGLSLERSSAAHQLSLAYSGGGSFYSVSHNLNSTFQSLSLTEIYSFNRWSLTLSDFLSYANQIGLGAASVPSYAYVFSPAGLQLINVPELSILTEPTPRILNTTVGQVEYRFGPHVSVTAGGSYGVLHFLNADFFNSNQVSGSAGINYTSNGKDWFALTYKYSGFEFDNLGSNLKTHSVQVLYGRRLSRRYAMQFGAGPLVLKESSVVAHVGWNATTSLEAKMGRTDADLDYHHTITAGSGVLLGANTDAVQLELTRELWRLWDASTQFGFARNAGLSSAAGNYSYLNAGASMSRKIGSEASVSFFFNTQHQAYGQESCLPNVCGVMRNTFGMGLQWDFRPIRLK